MNTRRHYTQTHEADFAQVKALSAAGLSKSKIAKVMDRSISTIIYMVKANSYEEYKQGRRDQIALSRAKRELTYTPTVQKILDEGEKLLEPKTLDAKNSFEQIHKDLVAINSSILRLAISWENKPQSQKVWPFK